jgi:Family of unknown function (DUF6090)
MIKFFRKIRYSLIEKNKTAKYLKYAIGEIGLVVIGILIALSINNANELRKTKTYEKALLTELQATIVDEIGKMKKRVEKNSESLESCAVLINQLEQNLPIHDSMSSYFRKAFSVWDSNIRFSAFENVKEHGLLFIEDERARYLLLEAYEVQIKFLEHLMERYDLYHYNTVAPELTKNFNYILNMDKRRDPLPANFNPADDNRKLKNMLNVTSDLLIQILNTTNRIVRILEKLDEKLTIEIASK